MNGMATQAKDSELQHSFGPQEIGFDYLPLELTPSDGVAVRTQPAAKVPYIDLNSNTPFELPEAPPEPASSPPPASRPPRKANGKPHPDRSPGTLWLEGDVLMCACPDCRAPMSVRLWLMAADCWNCGASIELTQEQEREALRLLKEREEGAATALALPAAPPDSGTRSVPATLRAPAPAAREAVPETPPQQPRRRPAQRRRTQSASSWLHKLLKDTPAWLISMLIHMVALTLMGLIPLEQERESGETILLSSASIPEPEKGGDTLKIKQEDDSQFDLPVPNKSDLQDPEKRQVLLAAAQDAKELRLNEPEQNLPPLEEVRKLVGNPNGIRSVMAARDPRLRVEMVAKEGGTTLTEASVARGLKWLSLHQNNDGSWSVNGFQTAGKCNCNGQGGVGGKSAGTALAMLPYLGAGQTHLVGKYKHTVSRGLRWMIENQGEDGDLRAGSNDNSGMYTHGQATIVLCEAFAMTGDEQLRLPAQKAVDFIVKAQYRDGGWRYQPGPPTQPGDTSVVGWQLMALQSARAANLTVPPDTLGMAEVFLEGVSQKEGAVYGYQRGHGVTPAMTAEGLLCRMYLGWKKDNPSLGRGVRWLVDEHLPSERTPNIYYWYYGTQTLHHFGGEEWEKWNVQMRDVLVRSQETSGHVAGSWAPRDQHAYAGGRIYQTSLSICCLEVYYRHLPIFKQLELGNTHKPEAPAKENAASR
ncbi:MAG: prenyltransferase/squalene oxidase repeat-containing protein [Pirellulaceae bacterium]